MKPFAEILMEATMAFGDSRPAEGRDPTDILDPLCGVAGLFISGAESKEARAALVVRAVLVILDNANVDRASLISLMLAMANPLGDVKGSA